MKSASVAWPVRCARGMTPVPATAPQPSWPPWEYEMNFMLVLVERDAVCFVHKKVEYAQTLGCRGGRSSTIPAVKVAPAESELPLAEHAYLELRKAILGCEYEPGERLRVE